MRISPRARFWLMVTGFVWLGSLAGCSSDDNPEEPFPLPEFVEDVSFDEVWSRSVGKGSDDQLLFLQPVLREGILYAVDVHGRLDAITATDGERLWRHHIDEPILAGVGADHSRLYVVNRKGQLLALSMKDGSELWRQSLSSEVLAPPQSNGALVVVQTIDGKVFGLDAEDGKRRWQYDSVVPVLSFRGTATPWVGANQTLAGFANGQLMAFSNEDGRPLWQYTVGQPQGRTELERLVDVDSSPRVLDDVVYVTGYQGRLAALALDSGQELWSRKTSSLQTPAAGFGNIYVARADGSLVAYNLSSRQEVWKQDQLSWRQLSGPESVADNLVVGDFEGYLHAISQKDGRIRGRVRVDSDGMRVPILRNGDQIIVYGNGGELAAYRLLEE